MKENEDYEEKPDIDISDDLVNIMFIIVTRVFPAIFIGFGMYRLTEADYFGGVFCLIFGIGVLVSTVKIED